MKKAFPYIILKDLTTKLIQYFGINNSKIDLSDLYRGDI